MWKTTFQSSAECWRKYSNGSKSLEDRSQNNSQKHKNMPYMTASAAALFEGLMPGSCNDDGVDSLFGKAIKGTSVLHLRN